MSGLRQDEVFKTNGENLTLQTKDGEEIGFICWHVFPERKVLEVHLIYVDKKFQRKGYGTMLIQEVLKKYTDYENVYLHVVATNIEAINFYLHFGFKVMFGYRDLYGEKQNSFFLVKKLKAHD